jgi:hypothetical protein
METLSVSSTSRPACRDGPMSHVERNFGKRSREENRNLSLEVALDLLEAVMRASEEPRQAG